MLRMFAGPVLDLVDHLAALRAIRGQQAFGPSLVRNHPDGRRGCTTSRRLGDLFPDQNLLP
jgi:hypothetical protein